MSYSFPKDAKDGDTVTLDNGVKYQYQDENDRWVVKSVGAPAADGRRKDFIPQLKGSFEIDDDGKAVIPDNAFYISEEDNEDGWKDEVRYPGVWWTGKYYDPSKITHLMVSQSRYVEGVNEDGEYVYDELSWTKEFYPNDIIRVSASAHELYHEDADGWLDESDHYAQRSDDAWRVKSVLDIADRDDYPRPWGFRAYELERIIPKDQYSGQWFIGEDEAGDDWFDKYFSPVSVTNHYIEKQPQPFLHFKQKERSAYWARGAWQGVDGGNYIKQNPKEIAKINFSEVDYYGSEVTVTTWAAGDTLFIYEEDAEVASFVVTNTERVKGSGYSIELTVDQAQTTGDADLSTEVYLKIPNPLFQAQEESEDGRKPNKDWAMQLRGNFEFDGDGKAVMPSKSYSNTDDNPVVNPDTGLTESGWQKPGVYWHGAELYAPESITHFMISKAAGLLAAHEEGDGAYISYEEHFFQDWKVGDLIEVKAHEYTRWEADYYGKLLHQKTGGFHNNTWRVVEEVDVVNPDNDWPVDAYSCLRVEKVAPDNFYKGSIEVLEDKVDGEFEWTGFYPCEVTMNPAATQVDIEKLQSEIIELEEEIDAIAPSVERGVWKFNLSGAVASRGQITMYDGMNKTGSPIGLFKSAKSVWLNELDSDGTPHGFANVNEGDLIELFVQGEADYGLFTVVAIHDESDGDIKYWVIDVDFVRALSPESKADNADSLRVKIIQPPSANGESGGDGNDHLNRKYPMTVAWKSGVEETHTMKSENQMSKWSNSNFGGHSAEVFKNLFQWFPPEEYEFIPGNIIWFEKKVSGGRAWEVQPPHAVLAWHATNVIEFTSVRQHLQGHSSWAGFGVNDSQPDRDNLAYEVIFQCFRRKG
jgi:hypothetical protein